MFIFPPLKYVTLAKVHVVFAHHSGDKSEFIKCIWRPLLQIRT